MKEFSKNFLRIFLADGSVYMDGPSQLNSVVLGRNPKSEPSLKISYLPSSKIQGADSGTFHSAAYSQGIHHHDNHRN